MPRNLFSRWRYSTRLLFSGCDQATYQQDLVIHRTAGQDHEETSGGLKTWHIYIGPRCRPDYGDLRFTDGDARELAYYLWPGYDAESARFAVRLEEADSAGVLTIHYGNPAAVTTSDGNQTFPVCFYDFDDRSLDGWTPLNGTWTAQNQMVESSTLNRYIRTTDTIDQTELIWEFDVKVINKAIVQVYILANGNVAYEDQWNVCITTSGVRLDWSNKGAVIPSGGNLPPGSMVHVTIARSSAGEWKLWQNGAYVGSYTRTTVPGKYIKLRTHWSVAATYAWDNFIVRAYSATPPSLLRSTRGVNPSYARLVGALPVDSVIRFAGVGDIQVLGDERDGASGVGSFAIETLVRSPIAITGTSGMRAGINLAPAPAAPTGTGGVISEPARLHTPLDVETVVGTPYVAPAPVQFDVWQYRFESLEVSRSAQDALWRCEGRIVGLDAPLAYKQFEVRVPDHNGVLRTIFVGFVPGRDYVQAVAANESIVQGYDAGFYLARQYLPDGDLNYPKEFAWGPMSLLRYWLGEETTTAGSRSRWEQVTGIYPYRLSNPHSYYEWPYDKRIDWNFMPKTTKAQAIQEVCEKSGLVFLVKWKKIDGVWRPCAYLVPEEDIDHYNWGLDLPGPVTFTHPDPLVMDGVRVTMRSDEKYNRIVVRSASPSGAWFEAIRETPGLRYGDELPIEYLEERGDLPDEADHGGWCNMRADELYDYYTKYAYTYTLTLINRVDLELYQRCRFYGFDSIPSGEMMRIVAITYNVLPTHTEVEITVTPDSRLSDLRRLQRSQAADSVSEVQTIAQSQIDRLAAGEVGTVVGIDGAEAIVELERKADSSVRGRIV